MNDDKISLHVLAAEKNCVQHLQQCVFFERFEQFKGKPPLFGHLMTSWNEKLKFSLPKIMHEFLLLMENQAIFYVFYSKIYWLIKTFRINLSLNFVNVRDRTERIFQCGLYKVQRITKIIHHMCSDTKPNSIFRIRKKENEQQFFVLWHTASVAKRLFLFWFVLVVLLLLDLISKHVVYNQMSAHTYSGRGRESRSNIHNCQTHQNRHSKDIISYVVWI